MYSHDTFGLGHIHRCMTTANHLVERFSGAYVQISMLHPGDTADGMRFSAAIHKLLSQTSPSLAAPGYQMERLPNLSAIVRE